MRASGPTSISVALDNRQQWLMAMPHGMWEDCLLNDWYNYPSARVPVDTVGVIHHVSSRRTETMDWPDPWKVPLVNTSIQDGDTAVKRAAELCASPTAGKRNGRQGGIWNVDVMDGQISNARWQSWSRACELRQRQLDGHPQIPRYRMTRCIRGETLCSRGQYPQLRSISRCVASTGSHHRGSFSSFSGNYQMDGSPVPSAWVATSKS